MKRWMVLYTLLCLAAPAAAAPPAPAAAAPPAPTAAEAAPRRLAQSPMAELQYVRAMQRGQATFSRGDYASAEEEFRYALTQKPDSAEALNALGETQYRAGKFAESAQSFQKAAEAANGALRSRASYNLGNAMFKQNKLHEAADAYRKSLRYDEHDDDARHNLQVVLDKLKPPPQRKPQQSSDPQNKQQDKNKQNQNKNQQQANQNKGQQQKQQANQNKGQQQKQQANQNKGQQQKQQANQNKGQQQKQSAQARAADRQNKVAASNSRRDAASARRDEDERILQYFQDKERNAKVKPTPTAPYQPQPGEETW